jgi:hypothetical protein
MIVSTTAMAGTASLINSRFPYVRIMISPDTGRAVFWNSCTNEYYNTLPGYNSRTGLPHNWAKMSRKQRNAFYDRPSAENPSAEKCPRFEAMAAAKKDQADADLKEWIARDADFEADMVRMGIIHGDPMPDGNPYGNIPTTKR